MKQFVLFILNSGFAALVNFGSRIFYNQWVSFSIAIIFAYITGMITAFILNKLFVFKDSQRPVHHSALLFIAVNLIAALQTWAISLGLAYYLLPYLGITTFVHEISHLTGIIFPVFTSYIGHKYWTFK